LIVQLIVRPSYASRLVEKIPRAADIVTFRFERPAGHRYQAGQWFVVTFPGPAEPYSHHFSYSSSPTEPWLEFTTRVRASEFKRALDALPLGAEVEIEGPYGTFTLGEDLERVAFVAGGIGITCVRSILRWLVDNQNSSSAASAASRVADSRQIVLLFANRSEDGIAFRDELEKMEGILTGFRVVHVLSRAGDAWPGYRGHIDRQLVSSELPDAERWTYYVSGPPSFGASTREQLTSLGASPGSIKVEAFEGYE
jgi:glycine betaine catabolism B